MERWIRDVQEQYRLVLHDSEVVSVPSEKQQAARYPHEAKDTVTRDPAPGGRLKDVLAQRVMCKLPADGRSAGWECLRPVSKPMVRGGRTHRLVHTRSRQGI